MSRSIKVILITITVLVFIVACIIGVHYMIWAPPAKWDIPENGIVPDEATAAIIAEAVWASAFGEGAFLSDTIKVEYKKFAKTWKISASPTNNADKLKFQLEIKKRSGKIVFKTYKGDAIPNKEAAIKVIMAIWSAAYNYEVIEKQSVYISHREPGLWISFDLAATTGNDEPLIWIRESDGKVLYLVYKPFYIRVT